MIPLVEYFFNHLLAFRARALANDESFFEKPENVQVYRDFCQMLPYLWMAEQKKEAGAWPMPAGIKGQVVS